jgi:hypothetical protein
MVGDHGEITTEHIHSHHAKSLTTMNITQKSDEFIHLSIHVLI